MNIDVVTKYSRDALRHYNKNRNEKFLEAMKGFYTEGKKNPSNALIVMNSEMRKFSNMMLKTAENITKPRTSQYFDEPTVSFGESLELMVQAAKVVDILKSKLLETLPEHQEFYDIFEKLYPKSKNMRTKINYLETDRVLPKKSWTEKYLYFYNSKEQKEKYPRTYMLRLRLLLEERITDGKPKPKMKNCLEKRSMKKFIF